MSSYVHEIQEEGREKRKAEKEIFFLFPIIALFVNNIDNIIALED